MFLGKNDGEMPCIASELEKKHDSETYLSPEEQARIEEEKIDMKVELAANWLSGEQGRTWEAIGLEGVNEEITSIDDIENYTTLHSKSKKRAIKAGVRSIEHGTLMDDEAINLMKKNGTY